MSLRQTIRIAVRAMNRESLDALNTLQVTEPVQRYTRGPRCEAEDFGSLIPVE